MLSLGYSPCPNDCFIFYALVHDKIKIPSHVGDAFHVHLEDVETLNQWGRDTRLDVSKISYHAYAYMLDDYVMLRAGGALGRGVGPLLVGQQAQLQDGDMIAIPGGLTTANLLLKLWQPVGVKVREYRYDQIMPAVIRGEVQAGLIIHESRFTYTSQGLQKILDLGEWWEQETGLLIPLGGIMARREYGQETLASLNQVIQESLQYSYAHPEAPQSYIEQHAQEMELEVVQQHIDLYVNTYSLDIATDGEEAVQVLFAKGREKGILPDSRHALFYC